MSAEPVTIESILTFETGDGVTLLDEAPETPAPLFAVRAFKTALFGTPTPSQDEKLDKGRLLVRNQKKEPVSQNQDPVIASAQNEDSPKKNRKTPKSEQLISPAKGILLTPGTGASKRKTVSFRASKDLEIVKFDLNVSQGDEKIKPPRNAENEPVENPQRVSRQSAFTKNLLELSSKPLNSQQRSTSPQTPIRITDPDLDLRPALSKSTQQYGISFDETLDLSEPRSRSGKHWKKEFEEYQQRSSREMKRIIQHGQNVKCFAVKKDLEASRLGERLQNELEKVSRMESKVAKLAKRLSMAQSQAPEDETSQKRLVAELAGQTALAVRYQRKADSYRRTIARRAQATSGEDHPNIRFDGNENEQDAIIIEQAPHQHRFQDLEKNARIAEIRASKLEAENGQLKRSLARVKEEMTTYESRRQSREERLKRREEKWKSAKDRSEAELRKLKSEHDRLHAALEEKNSTNATLGNKSELPTLEIQERRNDGDAENMNELVPVRLGGGSRPASSSPRKRRPSSSNAVDVWTHPSSPFDERKEASLPTQEASVALGSSSVRQDVHRTMQEIDRNLLNPNNLNLEPISSPAAVSGRRLDVIKASKNDLAATDVEAIKAAMMSQPHHGLISGHPSGHLPRTNLSSRSASMISGNRRCHGLGSRASLMGSARATPLTAERVAAAKVRLAQKKRTVEVISAEG